MGCGSSQSVKTDSESSLKEGERHSSSSSLRKIQGKVSPGVEEKQVVNNNNNNTISNESKTGPDRCETRNSTKHSSGIAFEVMIGDDKSIPKPPPKRLSRLDPIDAPRLTADELEEKLRLAERKRNSELESRAKTASESRRLSKRKRELLIARDLERQHQQAQELETKLKSAEKQREIQLQQKSERQKLQEERIKRARIKKEKLLLEDDVISDVERDENFNNDDVDSWLEGSNNETNTVDTGFSSATSERIYSGRESPKKRFNPGMVSRSSYLNSASTVDSCDMLSYKQSRENLRKAQMTEPVESKEEEDAFFDS